MKKSKSKPTNTVSARKPNSVIDLNSSRYLVSVMNANVKKQKTSKRTISRKCGSRALKSQIWFYSSA